jgi:hypothetical protein
MQVGIGKVEHHATAMGPGFEANDTTAFGQRLIEQTERAKHGESRGLKQEPRTNRAGLGKSLEDGNAVAGIRQQNRRGLTGNAAADDADLERIARAQGPPFTARRA